jgi:DNA-binding transcriptional LysR family regulator
MRLDPISLRVFLATIETGTITAASAQEHIAAAAISKRISELEHTLKTKLLIRTNKGIEPTDAGVALTNLARRALYELDNVFIQMCDYADGVRGTVRVFANISAITQFLPDEIKSFQRMYPEVNLQLEEKISSVITKSVAENAADIGIFAWFPHHNTIETFPYHTDRLTLITPHNHPLASKSEVSFNEALDYDFVGMHTGSAINQVLFRAANDLSRVLRLVIQVTSYDALCMMVQSGLGIGVLPERLVNHYNKALGLKQVRLTEPWTDRELRLCVRSYQALPTAARLLIDHLRQNTKK